MARILIVEDELLIAEDLKYKLRRLGHTVVAHAVTGEAAFEKAIETKPELVLMDIRLRGEMNGIEAARRIRQVYPLSVIYVTAHPSSAFGSDPGYTSQDDDRQFYLTKPFTLDQLKKIIGAASQTL